jgi:hypothetical protein
MCYPDKSESPFNRVPVHQQYFPICQTVISAYQICHGLPKDALNGHLNVPQLVKSRAAMI